ncbi:hypothetical protein M407DRAFT_31535 [Tulasnella calospora MUT 4182]|uniref:Uncharacterized protein n=1 Tax=Tulasnella calospora MUT 4182 TaxID=1051891 RepID=A0A0C3PV49_9AGAM|nr:hypothetical protein M407DRAFT_31535 [Tulasnella calospora MUT 4182]
MTLSRLWTRKTSPKESKSLPPSPVSEGPRTYLKSRLPLQRSQEATYPRPPAPAKISTKTATHERKRSLLLKIISPRPLVHPARRPTTPSPSADNAFAPTQAVNSSSYPQMPRDSQFSNLLSQCEDLPSARPRADTLGVTRPAERHAHTLNSEENAPTRVEASPSQPPPNHSSNAVKSTETSENTPACEPRPACAPDSFESSSQYEGEVADECLSAAAIAQARRRRLRAQANRARRSSQGYISQGLFPVNLDALGSAGPAEDDGVAVNSEDESASDRAEALSAAAPNPLDPLLHKGSSDSVILTALAQHPLPSQSLRDSRASSASSTSLFEYDNPLSAPTGAVQDQDVGCERSSYDPVHQCFSLEGINTLGLTGSAENDGQTVTKDGSESASAKAGSLVAVAPTPSTGVSHPECCKVVIKITPPSPPTTMRPSPRKQSAKDRPMNLDNSHLAPPHHRPTSSPAKPRHSRFASRRTGMLVATRSLENHSPPRKAEEDQRVDYEARSSQLTAYLRPSNHTVSKVALRPVERENNGPIAGVRKETFSASHRSRTSPTLGSSDTLVDRIFPPETPNILRTTLPARNNCQVLDREEEDESAGGKARPLSSDAPIFPTPAFHREPRRVKRVAGGLVPDSFRQQARALKSSIASSLREWGNAATSLFVRRPAVQETGTFKSSFDPWEEGFVPPRGPSPDPMEPDGDFSPPQPSILNIYVKLD